jgi:hypothetical protein
MKNCRNIPEEAFLGATRHQGHEVEINTGVDPPDRFSNLALRRVHGGLLIRQQFAMYRAKLAQ